MGRKLVMLLAGLMICMPIGGLTTPETVASADQITTSDPVANPWMIDPVRLLLLCAVLLVMSRVEQYHRRQSLRP